MKINLDVFKMSQTKHSQETNELVQVLQDQNIRMIDLITSLLKFDSSDNIDLTKKIVLKDIVLEVIESLKIKIENKDINISVDIDNISFNGNEMLLKNAFSNIIENAIKYNNQGGQIHIYTDDKKILHIKDNGIGVEEQYQDKIFEPLFRVNKSRNRDISGVGLGLALTFEIIKKHNGSISVISDGKTYSDFIINLTTSF